MPSWSWVKVQSLGDNSVSLSLHEHLLHYNIVIWPLFIWRKTLTMSGLLWIIRTTHFYFYWNDFVQKKIVPMKSEQCVLWIIHSNQGYCIRREVQVLNNGNVIFHNQNSIHFYYIGVAAEKPISQNRILTATVEVHLKRWITARFSFYSEKIEEK